MVEKWVEGSYYLGEGIVFSQSVQVSTVYNKHYKTYDKKKQGKITFFIQKHNQNAHE